MLARDTCSTLAVLLAGLLGAAFLQAEVRELKTQVCVVGGGSGGYSATIAAARAGADCILVERLHQLGGTSTAAYVCNWEPGPGDSIAREIYQRLGKLPRAVGITSDHNFDRSKGPFGLWLLTRGLSYDSTLQRAGLPRLEWRAVVFDPDALNEVVSQMLAETGNCRTVLGTTLVKAQTEGGRLVSIHAQSDGGTSYRIRARVFIDSTGGAHLCRAAGYETMLGPEGQDRFHEPFAPDSPQMTLNAISLCYRIRRSENPVRQSAPHPPLIDDCMANARSSGLFPKKRAPAGRPPLIGRAGVDQSWPRSAHVTALPGGDLIVNPLAMLPGRALVDMGYDKALATCKRIVQAHWRWLQSYPTFADYEFHSSAPMLGIRESYRVVGEYVLTQHDLQAGLEGQSHPDIVAVADHAMDVHGEGGRRVHGELEGPYGIPYRCLVPKGSENLLVACRGASFSHIAASSCRLSRTMIQLGHAAGLAAAVAVKEDLPVAEVDVAALQEELQVNCPSR